MSIFDDASLSVVVIAGGKSQTLAVFILTTKLIYDNFALLLTLIVCKLYLRSHRTITLMSPLAEILLVINL